MDRRPMHAAQHAQITNLIWTVADDVLRDVFVRGKYRDVILPMTVIRRLDTLLEDTKEQVLRARDHLAAAGILNQDEPLKLAAQQPYYNLSPFTLKTLLDHPSQLRQNFEAYLDGFSPNVRDILDRFKFRDQLSTLQEHDALGFLIARFTRSDLNLSPRPVLDAHGAVRLPGLDNHAMGTVFEELIRRFNEANNEEAGEHFTPRDVVALMARLLVLPVADRLASATYLVYDGACGTGGMLTVAEETLRDVASAHGKQIRTHLYGQEVNAETYAITKADLILKGEGEEANNIAYGSTLTQDAFPHLDFDFMLSNPPYGKSWKRDLDTLGGKGNVKDRRFVVDHAGDPDFTVLPRSSDGQMLFLVNLLQKMKHGTTLGSRIAEVHNGSALFTGDAGSGESNIRRWVIESDWLKAIVALPLNIFYNTGIATYVWVLTNRKPDHRRGFVQLIDATAWHKPLRRNLGARNREMTEADIARVVDTFQSFEETEHSKIFPNDHFGYRKVVVERPLRLLVDFRPERIQALRDSGADDQLADAAERIVERYGDGYGGYSDGQGRIGADPGSSSLEPPVEPGTYRSYDRLVACVEEELRKRLNARRTKVFRDAFCTRSPEAEPVTARRLRTVSFFDEPPVEDRLHGVFSTVAPFPMLEPGVLMTWRPESYFAEYEPDPDLRDTEQIPLLEPDGVDGFMRREVWPHVPDAWVDPTSEKVGYEFSFNREFYKPAPMRSLEEIETDILSLEKETLGLLTEIVGVGNSR